MRIIVSADDFGLSHECNLGVDYCMRNGIAQTAQLVVNTHYTQEAIELARKGGYMDKVGLHINLVSGQAISIPITSIGCYYDRSNKHFLDSSNWSYKKVFGVKYVNELREEIEAQTQLFLTYFSSTMLSTHHDVIFHRPIFKAIKPLIKKYGFLITRGVEPYLFDLTGRYSKLRSVKFYPFKFYYYYRYISLKQIGSCSVLHGGRIINHFNRDFKLMKSGKKFGTGNIKQVDCCEVVIHPFFDGTNYYDKTNYQKGQFGLLRDTIDKLSNIERVSLNELITR